jgi:hypothetical protein
MKTGELKMGKMFEKEEDKREDKRKVDRKMVQCYAKEGNYRQKVVVSSFGFGTNVYSREEKGKGGGVG